MQPKRHRAPGDGGNLRFAVLALVRDRPEGKHGYRLKPECEALTDEFWQLNYGRLYRVLDVLERSGELTVVEEIQTQRPNRKIYRITERGQRSLDDWLLQPVSDQSGPLRDELALKILFAKGEARARLYKTIQEQRSIYFKRLSQIGRRQKRLKEAGLDGRITDLVMEGAEQRVRTDLEWLDHVERRILHGALD
ncbi:MAG: helix-turn-helix transcriptional regulator [Deltaproteobacteria bacterium]|nr:helix-turn-helix transcriptional regulator [Deltaproteobacteria bacterium]